MAEAGREHRLSAKSDTADQAWAARKSFIAHATCMYKERRGCGGGEESRAERGLFKGKSQQVFGVRQRKEQRKEQRCVRSEPVWVEECQMNERSTMDAGGRPTSAT